jgi:hypothetical protein
MALMRPPSLLVLWRLEVTLAPLRIELGSKDNV